FATPGEPSNKAGSAPRRGSAGPRRGRTSAIPPARQGGLSYEAWIAIVLRRGKCAATTWAPPPIASKEVACVIPARTDEHLFFLQRMAECFGTRLGCGRWLMPDPALFPTP